MLIIYTSVLQISLFWRYSDAGGGELNDEEGIGNRSFMMLLVVFAVGCKKADTPKAPEKKAEPAKAPAPAPAPEKKAEPAPAPAPAKAPEPAKK